MAQQDANKRRAKAAAKLWESRKAEILWLYHDRDLSQNQMAEYYGLSLAGIQKAMARLGIQPIKKVRRAEAHPNYKHGKATRLYRTMITKDKCRKCKTKDNLGIHHKNDDHYDNRLENLEVLCNSCHMSITKRKWWKAKKAGKPLPKSNGPVGWK